MKHTFLAVLLLVGAAYAKDKNYPLTGTVESFHAEARIGGVFNDSGGFVGTSDRRVYVVKTESGSLEIAGCAGRFKDRNGPPMLSLGQTLKFYTEKGYLYTVVDGKERKFYFLSAK
jgi:hypothetical protein